MKHGDEGTHFYCNVHNSGPCCGCSPRNCKYEPPGDEDKAGLHYRKVNENGSARRSLKDIIKVLGPEAVNCGCPGCFEEMSEALLIAKNELGYD